MKYQLTEDADRDVKEILAYSVKSFGVAQTENYFEALKKCIELLADNPNMGNSAEDILPEYLRFPHESHIIFYKNLSSSILVVRILHERMDPKLHLKK
ncbi:MAG: type II toxin-antitoxin system RelE/ParE family toxin [Gammaproteobacteria bacterium]|nr:MAG: type II toxin-antitoxin system RelE/ParE family toxin [Gammaproteobacteria bacterium]